MNQSNEPLYYTKNNTHKNLTASLCEQSASLQLALQLNRNILIDAFQKNENNSLFPRSYTMRFLMQHNIQKILKKFLGRFIASKTLNSLSSGVSTAYFAYRTMTKT